MASAERSCVTFRETFGHDVKDGHAWFDLGAFGEIHDIDGHKVKGVLTRVREHDYRRRGETEGYTRGSFVLYVRSTDITNVTAGQQVKINGAKYVVKSHSEMLGEARRIELEGIDP